MSLYFRSLFAIPTLWPSLGPGHLVAQIGYTRVRLIPWFIVLNVEHLTNDPIMKNAVGKRTVELICKSRADRSAWISGKFKSLRQWPLRRSVSHVRRFRTLPPVRIENFSFRGDSAIFCAECQQVVLYCGWVEDHSRITRRLKANFD